MDNEHLLLSDFKLDLKVFLGGISYLQNHLKSKATKTVHGLYHDGTSQTVHSVETIFGLVPSNVGLRGFPLRRVSRSTYLTENFRFSPIPRTGYRYREDVDKARKIEDFPGCSFISPHRFYYFTIQRDDVITLMETSP
ncbi:hypothetical protein PIB30_024171 [Stylosanthes scabra]|uniref:Uncharacterized protein n=1 Tax=Stylosanthes scabra TaxID=79078 RepID=A0ABU6Y8N7_9FABA|nr:hypothetical protein [Stylosanthes scabra]